MSNQFTFTEREKGEEKRGEVKRKDLMVALLAVSFPITQTSIHASMFHAFAQILDYSTHTHTLFSSQHPF